MREKYVFKCQYILFIVSPIFVFIVARHFPFFIH